MALAPILLFTYKRLDTLKTTIEKLKENHLAKESTLFIFSDGAKRFEDELIVKEVRDFIDGITGFKAIEIFKSEKNKGLAKSIISGVSQVIDQYDKVIVLEDDLSTSPNFLTFMNQSLVEYAENKKVFSISGYSFNLGHDNRDFDAYFLNRGWSWGWATWSNRWNEVDWNVSDYEQFVLDKFARREFSKGGSDLNKMLDEQMSGKLDSWAIRCFYHQFRNKGLTLYPVLSKVYNNGFDADATHTTGSGRRYEPQFDISNKLEFKLPVTILPDRFYQNRFKKKMGIFPRVVSKIDSIFRRLVK